MKSILREQHWSFFSRAIAVDRGQYGDLPLLVVTAVVIGFIVPLAAIMLFGRRAI